MKKQAKINKALLSLLFLIFLIPAASATSPFISSVQAGQLQIQYPPIDKLPQNTDYNFAFHLFNGTNGLPLFNQTGAATRGCYFDLNGIYGEHLFSANITKMALDDKYDFEVLVKGKNFSNIGRYYYVMQCNGSAAGGSVSQPLDVTSSGTSGTSFYFLFAALAFGFLIVGIATKNIPVTIIGGFAVSAFGLYMLINGIDGFRNFIIETVSTLILSFGLFWMAKAGLEQLDFW